MGNNSFNRSSFYQFQIYKPVEVKSAKGFFGGIFFLDCQQFWQHSFHTLSNDMNICFLFFYASCEQQD